MTTTTVDRSISSLFVSSVDNKAQKIFVKSSVRTPSTVRSLSPRLPQVYWIGPVLGAVLAGVSHEFFFARGASRHKLLACLTCRDIEIVEATSVTGSSLSTVTQSAMRAKQANKQDNN
ncbi:Hypothetical protein SMAX5B_016407 [Scophthalmus maximus]|uniref:Uncharacterized protein n=1 Tax=Scophthalmus maximus TaxID=52904 RepID=A0A2U9C2G4_SCOMX|nr:Hypothetical protein SMAX5B_016407 [Scophthalmus maximus]